MLVRSEVSFWTLSPLRLVPQGTVVDSTDPVCAGRDAVFAPVEATLSTVPPRPPVKARKATASKATD